MKTKIKHLLFIVIAGITLFSCTGNSEKILLYIREDSGQLDYMLENEVFVMKDILEKAGFEVFVATKSAEQLGTDSTSLLPDLKLSEVEMKEFSGLIIPCMVTESVPEEAIELVKNAVAMNKPVAAQVGAVKILGEAGVLTGKKFTYAGGADYDPEKHPEFQDGIYSGPGVVRDGVIITSGTCPWMTHMNGGKDGTVELTNTLVNLIRDESLLPLFLIEK